jgi:diguanylate cyclase (GGDEF)-like protein
MNMPNSPVPAALPRVCVVDDDPTSLAAIAKLLQPQFEVVVARSGREALRLVRRHPPDLVLLDIEMPDMDGFAVCRRLKDDALTEQIPVVFLTASRDEAIEERGLGEGASDFIAKPPRGPVVLARIHNLVRMKQLAASLRVQAQTDDLTGLPNRGHFTHVLDQELKRARRQKQTVSLLMIDIDHFKGYNDHYGHLGGDGALRQVAKALMAVAKRTGDLACRYGGEEFAVVLPATDAAGARTVAAAVLAHVNAMRLPHAASAVAPHITLSIGLASLVSPASPASPVPHEPAAPAADTEFGDLGTSAMDQLIERADSALYAAKRHGRNQAWADGEQGCVWVAGSPDKTH